MSEGAATVSVFVLVGVGLLSSLLGARIRRARGKPPPSWASRGIYVALALVCVVVGYVLLQSK